MTWGSTAPAALTALITALSTVDAKVLDGPVVSDSGTLEAVSVGYQDDDTPAIEATLTVGVPAADLETYAINCAIRVLNGRDMIAARTRAFALLAEVGAAIRVDSSLGNAVMRAAIGTWQLTLERTSNGELATILFAVDVDAYTTP